MKLSARLHAFGKLWGENVSFASPASKGHLLSLTRGLFLHLQSYQCSVFELQSLLTLWSLNPW